MCWPRPALDSEVLAEPADISDAATVREMTPWDPTDCLAHNSGQFLYDFLPPEVHPYKFKQTLAYWAEGNGDV